jgi:CheY-like chemotaxis protein
MEASALILHVEDDPIDVGNLRRAFSHCGITNPIRSVPNAMDALALLRGTGGGARVRPGIILLDLGLPGISGLEFLRAVKSDPALRVIPVVVFSASRHARDLEAAYRLGASGYVVKPIAFEDFVRAVATVQQYWAICEVP